MPVIPEKLAEGPFEKGEGEGFLPSGNFLKLFLNEV